MCHERWVLHVVIKRIFLTFITDNVEDKTCRKTAYHERSLFPKPRSDKTQRCQCSIPRHILHDSHCNYLQTDFWSPNDTESPSQLEKKAIKDLQQNKKYVLCIPYA